MAIRERIVVDANALISRLLLPSSVPGQAVRMATHEGQLLASDATLEELADVLSRPKFDSYVTLEERQAFMLLFGRIVEHVPITRRVRLCRDPKDDAVLELALNGGADLIITGDRDLLALGAFENRRILTPAAYLARRAPT